MNYGAEINTRQLQKLLKHQFQRNRQQLRRGLPGVPICIWGPHGIGKTQMVRDFAKANQWKIVSLAPAQFEEMGDLIGMPQIEGGRTVLRKPAWVPEDFGPGILLLDDFNRADDRILKGLMPLLQDGKLVSWGLPPDWHIVLTGNPDRGDYHVTPLDPAMFTRMLNVQLEFAVSPWADWAVAHRLPTVLIDFVLLHPEVIAAERSTARSLVQFFESIQELSLSRKNRDLIEVIAQGYLDEQSVGLFMTYVKSSDPGLPAIKTLLESEAFTSDVAEPLAEFLQKTEQQLDVLSAYWNRLYRTLKAPATAWDERALQNLEAFLKLSSVPEDLRKYWVLQLVGLDRSELNALFTKAAWKAYLL
ncbi:MAG TPA: AAA family ATPase [Saprospiraceae bacterium]|nr:AAA family ATPase [Saprospiraceae bacterium]